VTQLTCDEAMMRSRRSAGRKADCVLLDARRELGHLRDGHRRPLRDAGDKRPGAGPAPVNSVPTASGLVYCSAGSRSGNWELWTVNLATSEKKMIGVGLFPSWSPDKNA